MATDSKPKDDLLSLRMTTEEVTLFRDKADEMGRKSYDIHRELILAFIDGRVTITETEEQKKQRGLYK